MGTTGRNPDRLAEMAGHPAVKRLQDRLSGGGWVRAQGRSGSSTVVLAGLLSRLANSTSRRPVLLVRAHLDEADEAVDELRDLGIDAQRFPAMELVPGESNIRLDLLSDRLTTLQSIRDQAAPSVLVAPITAIMQVVPPSKGLDRVHRVVRTGGGNPLEELIVWMAEAGYSRVQAVNSSGEFAVRGDILDIYPAAGGPARLDYFGDEIESIHEIDLSTMGSDRRLDRLDLVAAGEQYNLLSGEPDLGMDSLVSMLDSSWTVLLDDWIEINEQARSYQERVSDDSGVIGMELLQQQMLEISGGMVTIESAAAGGEDLLQLPVGPVMEFSDQASEAFKELGSLAAESNVSVWLGNEGDRRRFGELLHEYVPDAELRDRIEEVSGYLHRGFRWEDDSWISYHELIHRYQVRRRVHRKDGVRAVDAFVDLKAGDFAVHRDHGIASLLGLQMMGRSQDELVKEEFLTLEFAKNARLHVPVSDIELVQRYVGGFHGKPDRSILGGKRWQDRSSRPAIPFVIWLEECWNSRPFGLGERGWHADPTACGSRNSKPPSPSKADQMVAIQAVKTDLETPRPMDRLVCGDVGFGKTEVAIRAAFKMVRKGIRWRCSYRRRFWPSSMGGHSPTRFAGYPIGVGSLSRFRNKAQQREILEALSAGQVDVIIGTHRLLSKDVEFNDLGLVVVDEEQRFGVEHKQRLVESPCRCGCAHDDRDANTPDTAHVDPGTSGHLFLDDRSPGSPGRGDRGDLMGCQTYR